MLDQHFGFFPNVTRSNTNTKNALELREKQEVYYITRTYQTRHGNGYMTNEDLEVKPELKNNENETNVLDEYQGVFRKSLLDIDLLNYAHNNDIYSKGLTKHLMITCADQVAEKFPVTKKGKIIEVEAEEIAWHLDTQFTDVFISRGPTIKDIERCKIRQLY